MKRLPSAAVLLALANAQEVASLNDLEVKNRALAAITGMYPGALAGLASPASLVAPQPADIGAVNRLLRTP